MASVSLMDYIIKSKFNFKKAYIYYKAYDQIMNSPYFNKDFYLENYPNVSVSGIDPLTHYLFHGQNEGKFPSLSFDGTFYLNQNPSIKEANMNPLVHYVLYGKEEGKKIHSPYLIKRDKIKNTNLIYLNNYTFDEEPLVSIIILTHNGIENLKLLFTDFSLKTNYLNFEIIVVDNNSNDGSVEYLESLNVDFTLKIIKNNENFSFSKANNQGVEASSGEYVLLMNNDVEPTYGWLNEMMGIYLYNDNVGAVGAKLIHPYYYSPDLIGKSLTIQHIGDIFGDRMSPCCAYAYNMYSLFHEIFDIDVTELKKRISVTAACVLIKKSIYEELGGLDEEYVYGNEDVDFGLKLHTSGYKTFYCPSAVLFHHESSTRTSSKSKTENFKHNIKYFWDKWGDYLSRNILLDKIDKNVLFSERPLKFLFINDDVGNFNRTKDVSTALSKEFAKKNYELELIDVGTDFLADEFVDVVISFSTDYGISNLKCRNNVFKILCLADFKGNPYNIKDYDIIICDNDAIIFLLEKSFDNLNIFKINFRQLDSESLCNEFLDAIKEFIKVKYPVKISH